MGGSQNNQREIVNTDLNQSYWAFVKRQFKKNKRAVFSLYLMLFLAFIGISADFIANEKPLIAKYNDTLYFPVFKSYAVDLGVSSWPKELQNVEWKELDYDFSIWPLIPYLPQNIDFMNAQYKGPFDDQYLPTDSDGNEMTKWTHWLGTDDIGRDVMAGMIHGTRIAFLVGFISMGIASMIGIFLGSIAGFFGDDRLKISRIRLILNLVFLVFAYFYALQNRAYILGDAMEASMGSFVLQLLISLIIFIGIMVIPNLLTILLKKIPFLGAKIALPMDLIVTRMIEILVSIPRLILILGVVALVDKPSIFIIMIVIGLTSWTGIARFIRAELMKVKNLEYMEAAQALGFSSFRTLVKHAIPNALSPVFIAIAFGVAAAILIESTLSFLGIGVSADTITWGSLLSLARKASSAWWLAIFPGVAIFITVTIFNLIGEGLTDALDPRLKR